MRTSAARLWIVPWLASAAACGPAPDDAAEPPEASAIEASGAIDDGSLSGSADTSWTDASPPAGEAEEPSPFPDLDGETVLRTYELWIVNRSSTDAFVYASAGAGRVVLDTVPGRDSVKVNVQVRALSLSLDAQDEEGRRLGSAELELVPGSPTRWEIMGSGGAR